MKKAIALVLLLTLTLSLGACGKPEKEVPEKIPALLVEVDPENRYLSCEPAQEGVFRSGLTIDCSEAPVYQQNQTEEMSFLDLEPGDRVVLTFDEAGRKDIGKNEDPVRAVRVDVGQ